jgi:hypothetical protein
MWYWQIFWYGKVYYSNPISLMILGKLLFPFEIWKYRITPLILKSPSMLRLHISYHRVRFLASAQIPGWITLCQLYTTEYSVTGMLHHLHGALNSLYTSGSYLHLNTDIQGVSVAVCYSMQVWWFYCYILLTIENSHSNVSQQSQKLLTAMLN